MIEKSDEQPVSIGGTGKFAAIGEIVGVGSAEQRLTGHLLAHLVELEERKLHLELGFSSLFAYCVEGLGMSEGTAGRRVTAARMCILVSSRPVASAVSDPRRRARELEPLSADRLGVHFTADAELRDRIERARARESSTAERRSRRFDEADGGVLRSTGRQAALRHRSPTAAAQGGARIAELDGQSRSTRWSRQTCTIRTCNGAS